VPAATAFVVYLAIALFDGAQSPLATAALTIGIWSALALSALVEPRPPRPSGPALLAIGSLLVLVLLIAASSTWTADDGRVFIDGVRAAGYLGALAVVAVGVRYREVRPILAGVAAAIVAVAAIALGSRLFPDLLTGDATFLREFPDAVRGRLSYPTGYWNGLAATMAAGAILLVWLGSNASTRLARSAAIGALPLLLLTIYLTGSRGGLLAAILGVGVLLALSPVRTRALAGIVIGVAGGVLLALAFTTDQDVVEGVAGRGAAPLFAVLVVAISLAAFALRRAIDARIQLPRVPKLLQGRWLALWAVGVVAALFLLGGGIERVGEITEEAKVDAYGRGEFSGRFLALGSNGRVQLWEAAVDAWLEEPLHGIGSGAFPYWWNANGTLAEPARDAHSLFLEVLAELGPLGLLSVLALFAAAGLAAARLTFGDRDGTVAALAGVLVAGAAGAAVDWTWEVPAAFALTLLAIGLLVGPMTTRPTAPRRAIRLTYGGGGLVPGLVRGGTVAVALVVIAAAGSLLLSERAIDRSRELAAEGDLSGAAAAARDAARLQPGSEEPWLQLGQIQTLAGDYDAGVESFREALERAPGSVQANYLLTVALYSVGDPGYFEQGQRFYNSLPQER
jgi:O-antigen ligase